MASRYARKAAGAQNPGSAKRTCTVVACDRCRARKTRCNGLRPTCGSCSATNHNCHYVAEPDTPPIMALKIERDALRQQNDELQEMFRALLSVSQRDAMTLLERLRNGEELHSLLRLAQEMQQSPDEYQSTAPSAQEEVPEIPSTAVFEIKATQHASLRLLENFAAGKQPLEPKIEVFPAMPEIRPSSGLGPSPLYRS